MRQSAIDTTLAATLNPRHEQEPSYPFSAQLKGDNWHVFDASTGGWGATPFQTYKQAEAAALEAKAQQQAAQAARVLEQAEAKPKRASRAKASDSVGE